MNKKLKTICLAFLMIMIGVCSMDVQAESYAEKVSGNYTYIDYEGGAWIVGYNDGRNYLDVLLYGGTSEQIVWAIPETLDGKTVVGIGYGGTPATTWPDIDMDILYAVTDVIFPDTIKYIGSGMFMNNCKRLKSVSMPSGITEIEYNVFYGCEALESINIPEGVTEIGSGAFKNCKSLRSIDLPEGLQRIGESAFEYCLSLESVDIPATVRSISYNAFKDCRKVTAFNVEVSEYGDDGYFDLNGVLCKNSIEYDYNEETDETTEREVIVVITYPGGKAGTFHVSENMEVREYAFINALSLQAITVDENHPNYSGEDGVLYSKDKKTLLNFPCSRSGEFSIPDGVENIYYYAFSCSNLTNITIPNSVTKINGSAFSNCQNLQSMNVGSGVALNDLISSGILECSALAELTVSADNAYMATENNVLYDKEKTTMYLCPRAFSGQLIMPDSVTGLTRYVFTSADPDESGHVYACDEITEIKLGKSFSDDPYLKVDDEGVTHHFGFDVYIPKKLTRWEVAAGNTDFVARDGILYSADMKILWNCPVFDKDLVIPDGVESIDSYCQLYSSTYSITLPASIVYLNSNVTAKTIYGYTGSYAETYAKEEGIPFVSIGSVSNEDKNNTNQSDTNKTDENQPATEQTEKLPEVGTKTTLSSGQYKVSKSSATAKEVTFVKPKNSKKTSVNIPTTVKIDGYTYKVTEIASKAFKNNKKIKTLTIGNNVKKIGNEAFSGCKNLKKVTLGKGVTTIGKKSFYNCKKLKTITIKSTVLKNVGKNAIKNIDKKATIKVPKSKLKKYKSLFKSKTGYKKTMKIKK